MTSDGLLLCDGGKSLVLKTMSFNRTRLDSTDLRTKNCYLFRAGSSQWTRKGYATDYYNGQPPHASVGGRLWFVGGKTGAMSTFQYVLIYLYYIG